MCVFFPNNKTVINSSLRSQVVHKEMLFTCAFCSGETRQHTTEWQLRLNPRRSTRRVGSSAYIRHLPSIMSANFLSGELFKECRASSWKLFRLCFTESLITRAISTGSPWKGTIVRYAEKYIRLVISQFKSGCNHISWLFLTPSTTKEKMGATRYMQDNHQQNMEDKAKKHNPHRTMKNNNG